MGCRFAVHSLVLLLVAAATARADTVQVPQDFLTIQAAIDAAQDGDTVLVSAGTYTEAVTIAGRAGLVLKAKGKVVIDAIGAAPGLVIQSSTDIDVTGLRFADGAGDAVQITSSDFITLSKCRFDGFLGNGVRGDGALNVRVDQCILRDIGTVAIALPDEALSTDCDGFEVTRCKILNLKPGARALTLFGDAGVLEDCTVISQPDTNTVFVGRTGSELGTVRGNKFTNGTHVFDVLDSLVTDNRFLLADVNLEAPFTDFTDNVLKGSGIVLDADNAGDSLLSGNRITVLPSILPDLGIQISGANDYTVRDNIVKGKTETGIACSGAHGSLIEANVVRKASNRGIVVVNADGSQLLSNIVKACATGVVVDSGTAHTVSANVIKGSSLAGLVVDCNDSTFSANIIKGTDGDGLILKPTTAGNLLTLNKVKGSGGFDLLDESGGANEILPDNEFGTTSP